MAQSALLLQDVDTKLERYPARGQGVNSTPLPRRAGQGCENNGGEGGIRTHGPVARSTVFETAPFNRSGTSPGKLSGLFKILAERVGFEPTVEFPLHTLSKRAP